MSKTSGKRYVVWEGKKHWIFNNRDDCKKQVSWYKDAKYKSFSSQEAAKIAFSNTYKQYEWKNTTGKILTLKEKKTIWLPIMSSISTDAACSWNPWLLEYRWVLTDSKKEIFSFWPFQDWTVNIWEYLALVEWIKYAIKHKYKIIYSDSKTALSRIKNWKANTTLEPTFENSHLFVKLDEATSWLHHHLPLHPDLKLLKRHTALRGEIPADYGRK